MKKTAVVIAAWALAGCAVGIQDGGNSPRVTFEVDRPYQVVHARAVAQAQECLLGEESGFDGRRVSLETRRSAFQVREQLDTGARQGEVQVIEPLTGAVMALTRVRALDAGRSAVDQVVWGRGSWDAKTLRAMQQSVVMDASICTVYKVAE